LQRNDTKRGIQKFEIDTIINLIKPGGIVMFQWIKQKYKEHNEKKAIKRLPWYAKRVYSFDRKRKIGKRSLLSYDYSNRRMNYPVRSKNSVGVIHFLSTKFAN
jgi:hypothetical protein